MASRRWTNQGQPQTLQIGVFLLYANAAFLLFDMLRYSAFPLLFLAAAGGLVAGGYGIANEWKWGYTLGVVMAFSPFLLRLSIGASKASSPPGSSASCSRSP